VEACIRSLAPGSGVRYSVPFFLYSPALPIALDPLRAVRKVQKLGPCIASFKVFTFEWASFVRCTRVLFVEMRGLETHNLTGAGCQFFNDMINN
jgi:hypothetical protein